MQLRAEKKGRVERTLNMDLEVQQRGESRDPGCSLAQNKVDDFQGPAGPRAGGGSGAATARQRSRSGDPVEGRVETPLRDGAPVQCSEHGGSVEVPHPSPVSIII